MDKQIPVYFDTIVLDTPVQEIHTEEEDICRLRVGVFTKYRNRNGSYITDEYAAHLIESATQGTTPVVGFFDPETQEWASHTGPALANGYGYVERFEGWEPMTDTDGITREYAVFSVVLFTKYYEEAKKIRGQHQSMELDINSIQGDWAEFEGEPYFVYTAGDMLGLCVIGAHEPCFSVSSFFAKDDDKYESQYEKFSSLLFALRARVEEAEQTTKGGEHPMEDVENIVETEPAVEHEPDIVAESQPEPVNFEAAEKVTTEEIEVEETTTETVVEEETTEENTEVETVSEEPVVDWQAQCATFSAQITELQNTNAELTQTIEQLQAANTELQQQLSVYAAQAQAAENQRKNALLDKYAVLLTDVDAFNSIKDSADKCSYNELESKLAITFANQQMAVDKHEEKIPLPEVPESRFALLMKKYRKNN